MFHYEVIILIHPKQNEIINNIINYYKQIILKDKGKIHRFEDWGYRELAYIIKNNFKAYYILLNIEVLKKTIIKLKYDLQVNDNIIRTFIIKIKKKIISISPILKIKNESKKINENLILKKIK